VTALLRVAVIARATRPLHGQGGLEQSVYDLVRHLAAREVRVTVITPPPLAGHSAMATPFGVWPVTLVHVPYLTFPFANRPGTTILDRSSAYPLFGWRAGRVALRMARAGAIDVVHAFGASGLGYAMGRRKGDPPLVMNPQGLEEFGASATSLPLLKRVGYGPLRAAVRATAHRAAMLVSTDRALEPVVQRHLHPTPGQMVTIPNGIDVKEVDQQVGPAAGPAMRLHHGIDPQDLVLLSVGRLEHNKGFDILARALGQLTRSNPSFGKRPWRWVLAGEGPFRSTIEAVIQAEGLANHVLLAGRVSDQDLHAWYEAATMFVHPSRYEGSSLVTLEAMAHRRAVIATRAGGLPDKVQPGVNGWLVDVDSVEGLASAITHAASDQPALLRMGDASRRIVEQHFSWEVLVERYLTEYDRLLAGTQASLRP